MSYRTFADYYKENEKSLLDDISDCIAIASIAGSAEGPDNPFGKEVTRCLNQILHLGRNMGFKTENVDNYVGEITAGNGERMIGILCHADVVDAGNGWNTNPFQTKIIDGEMYGRGTIDDKGPMICCLYAMKYLNDNDLIPDDASIKMIIGTDEEENWISIAEYIKRQPKLPEISIVPDASFPVIYCEKGLINVEISIPVKNEKKNMSKLVKLVGGERTNVVPAAASCEILCKSPDDRDLLIHDLTLVASENKFCTDIHELDDSSIYISVSGKAAHAMTPEKGINAISCLMKLLYLVSKKKELNFEQQNIIDFFDRYISLECNGEKLGISCSDADSGALTVNIGLMSLAGNELKLSMNIRYPVTHRFEEIKTFIDRVCETEDADAKYGVCMDPIFFDKNSELIKTLMSVYRECTGDNESEPIALGGATYARAIPGAVAFGPVFPNQEELAHEANEHYSVADYKRITEIYIKALVRLCEG